MVILVPILKMQVKKRKLNKLALFIIDKEQ